MNALVVYCAYGKNEVGNRDSILVKYEYTAFTGHNMLCKILIVQLKNDH